MAGIGSDAARQGRRRRGARCTKRKESRWRCAGSWVEELATVGERRGSAWQVRRKEEVVWLGTGEQGVLLALKTVECTECNAAQPRERRRRPLAYDMWAQGHFS